MAKKCAFGLHKIIVKADGNDMVSLGGIYPFFVNFMSLLGLKDSLTSYVQSKRKGCLCSNMDIFHILADSLIFDRERIEHIGFH